MRSRLRDRVGYRRSATVILGTILTLGSAAAVAVPAGATPTAAQVAAPPQALPAPAGDAFYTPPDPLPPGQSGDIIWSRKVSLASFAFVITINADAYQILYRSTDALGRPIAVSGTVLVPTGKNPATVPIVGLADGSQGLGDQCAPSKELQTGADTGAFEAADVLNKGWAAAYTDYQGLGTPDVHTYVVGRAEGHAVIDSVRAAQRLGVGLSPTAKVAFFGYSQGGGAAAWAGEQQPTYAPELNLVGIAAGGIPADLTAVAKQLDGGVGFGVLAMAAAGFDAAYPELNLNGYLNAAGKSLFGAFKNECLTDILSAGAFHHISDYTTSNPLTNAAWIARLNENKLGATPPKVPIFMAQGIIDELVDSGQADALHKTYCRAGVKVTWNTFVGEHVLTAVAEEGNFINFLTDRFTGKAPTSNC